MTYYVTHPVFAIKRGVIVATTIWKIHWVHVVIAQQRVLMCKGKISLHTFQEIGPRLRPKASVNR